MNKDTKIAIIGGGIAGSSVAIYLGKLGLNITLFEQNDTIVSGPPICHLHAGGNLYREISNESCVTLLKESVDLVKLYPNSIDYRPTILAIPKIDDGEVSDLYDRLELLRSEYQKLYLLDKTNKVLCSKDEYFKFYDKETIERLQAYEIVEKPLSFDEWMIPFAKNVNLEKLKFPIIVVQEYGLNIFRLSASASLMLESIKNIKVLTKTKIDNIIKNKDGYTLEYLEEDKKQNTHFDYIINAAGFQTGTIDDILGFKRNRLVEFKSAYVTKWKSCTNVWAEVIFFGKRGTPAGMGQFTPYPDGHFQIHGMTEDITLFEDGLVSSSVKSSQPKLKSKFIEKIEKQWSKEEIEKRTLKAIEHIQQYIPTFTDVTIASKPLYGAQQIPGFESSLRTADVSFEQHRYARCEIVKASSVLTMCDLIVDDLIKFDLLGMNAKKQRDFLYDFNLDDDDITQKAIELCKIRKYPSSLANVNNPINNCIN